MLTVKTIKASMAVGDSHVAHLINKSGRRVRHRYYDTAAYVYGVGEPHYPLPALMCSVHIYHDMVIAVQSPPCCSGYHTKRLATGDRARF